jgi:Na+/H+ antiporter NhaD/arsenite permease-like protein
LRHLACTPFKRTARINTPFRKFGAAIGTSAEKPPPPLTCYLALAIFIGTYIVVAMGRLPGLRVDRTGAAIIGASMMIAANVLSLEEAYRAINFDTIILLFGMMIVVANLRLSGFFTLVSEWVIEHAHHPLALLTAIVTVAGVFSAFFVNDTMCLVLTPLVLEITTALRRNPVPYLLAVAMAANIGSVATVTGNPQNMIIASYSHVPYRAFAAALSPVAAAGLAVTIGTIYLFYRPEFGAHTRMKVERRPVRVNRPLLWKALAASAGMIGLFFAGWPVPKVAIVAGALLLLTRRVKPEKIYAQVDWPLLVMFSGLFVVLAGFEKSSLEQELRTAAASAHLDNKYVLSGLAAIASNLVSNVPAVLLFKPLIAHTADPARAWLTLAMSSTLAGNLTLLGSVANLIVAQRARGEVVITFWEYAKVGAPLAALTLLIGAALL